MNYGKSIKQLRTIMKQTQSEFSSGIGITQTYLSQIESGKKKPSTDMLERVATYSGVGMSTFLILAHEESDVREDKKEAFRLLKPIIDELVESLFSKD